MYSRFAGLFGLFIWLAMVFLSVVSCGNPRSGGSSLEEKSRTQQVKSLAEKAGSLSSFLPADTEIPGWKKSAAERTFLPENLWEYIDGGAEGYLAYDFQAVVTADYANEEADCQAVVDIYRMANPLCGFGIYSAERPQNAHIIEIGSQGYLTGNALHFWQGPYYVKITAFQEGVGQELQKLASAISAKLDAGAEIPPELGLFPSEGLVANSERYLARDVFGHNELKNGFTADYRRDGRQFKLFFILHDNPDSTSRSYELYKNFMINYAKGVEDHSAEEIPWFSADDPYYGKVVAMQYGKAILGVLGLENPELVNNYLQEIKEKLTALGLT